MRTVIIKKFGKPESLWIRSNRLSISDRAESQVHSRKIHEPTAFIQDNARKLRNLYHSTSGTESKVVGRERIK